MVTKKATIESLLGDITIELLDDDTVFHIEQDGVVGVHSVQFSFDDVDEVLADITTLRDEA